MPRTIDNRSWRDNNALPRNVYRASSLPRTCITVRVPCSSSVSRVGAIFRYVRPRGAIPEASGSIVYYSRREGTRRARTRKAQRERDREVDSGIFRPLILLPARKWQWAATDNSRGEENNAGRGIGYIERGSRPIPCLFVRTIIRCTILR